MPQRVQHIRSDSVKDNEALAPSASQITYGEIAINYAKGFEKMFIKNNENEIITFSCDNTLQEIISGHSGDIDYEGDLEGTIANLQSRMDEVESAATEIEYVSSMIFNYHENRLSALENGEGGVDRIDGGEF